ncbi:MAG: hypothetical protein KA886_03325 [Candidatus Cloacimonetes bacterium]|nr:hypothetical protein [Candidatus Cloacimonadota bacterium]
MKYMIFDDSKSDQFLPMTYLRSTGDLRAGILKLRQRIEFIMEMEESAVIVAPELISLYRERHPDWQINQVENDEYLFINSRARLTLDNKKLLDEMPDGSILKNADNILAIRLNCKAQPIDYHSLIKMSQDLCVIETDQMTCWEYLWELMHHNGDLIRFDFENVFYDEDNFFETEPGVTMLNPYDIWIGEGVELKTGVVIDASEGPVVIDENAVIMHNSVIIGPVYIGKKSVIKVAAKIYPNTSVGPVCKIGGEVEDTIIQGYSNKQHDGFLGHSYLGEWVNIGADTNNSDLKNTYKSVAVHNYATGEKTNTGSTFVGCFIGDHSKVGINCSINTGSMIGFGANLYGSPLIQGFIPDFSWGQANDLQKYRLEAFLETAGTVKQRRKKDLTIIEKGLLEEIYKRGINESR